MYFTKKVNPIHRFLAEAHFGRAAGKSDYELEGKPNHVYCLNDDKRSKLVHDFILMVFKVRHRVQREDYGGEENTTHWNYPNNPGGHGGVGVLKQVPHQSLYFRSFWLPFFFNNFILGNFLPVNLFFCVEIFLHAASGKAVQRNSPIIQVGYKCNWTSVGADVEAACKMISFKILTSWRFRYVLLIGKKDQGNYLSQIKWDAFLSGKNPKYL